MKSHLTAFALSFAFWHGLVIAQTEFKIPTSSNDLRGDLVETVARLRKAEAAGNAEEIARARQVLSRVEADYRDFRREEMRAEMKVTRSDASYRNHIEALRVKNMEHRERLEAGILKGTPGLLSRAKNEEERRRVLASQEADLRRVRADEELIAGIHSQYYGIRSRDTSKVKREEKVDSKVNRMDSLMGRMEFIDSNDSPEKDKDANAVHRMIKAANFDGDFSEFRRIANGRDFVDPDTGRRLNDHQQDRVRVNAITSLRQQLESRQHKDGLPGYVTNVLTGSEEDSRVPVTRQLRAEESLVQNKAHQYLNGTEASPKDYFRAYATQIQNKKMALHDWYNNEYLPAEAADPNDGEYTRKFKEWVNLGMGSAKRLIDEDGEDGVNTVKKQIRRLEMEADIATGALNRAASQPDPSKLPEADRVLLERMEIIKADESKRLKYQVPPPGAGGLNSVASGKLPPGATWLDGISVKSAVVTVAGAATGTASANLAVKGAQAMGAGHKAAAAAGIFSEFAVGAGTDVAMQTLEAKKGQKVNVDEVLLHNAFSSVAGKFMQSGGEALKSTVGARELLDEAGNKSFRELGRGENALRFASDALGVASDSSFEAVYESVKRDTPISKEEFMGMVLQGALSKTAGKALNRSGGDREEARKELLKAVPEEMRSRLEKNPELMDSAFDRARSSEARENVALGRFQNVMDSVNGGDGFFSRFKRSKSEAEMMTDPQFADRVSEGLRKGELNWADLKFVAEKKGGAAYPLLEGVAERRRKWAYGVDDPSEADVQARAEENLRAKFGNEEQTLRDKGSAEDSPEFQNLIAAREAQLNQLKSGNFSDDANGKAAKKAFSGAEGDLFGEAVMREGIGREVKQRAIEDLGEEFNEKRRRVTKELPEGEGRRNAIDALNKEQKLYASEIEKAEMIAPGSGDPTSDIDRSWNNARVLRSMKALQGERLALEGAGVKGVGPTTARAYDINEYYNGMKGVAKSMPLRNDPEKGFANLEVDPTKVPPGIKVPPGTTQDDYVAANSRAAAMQNMDSVSRAQYRDEIVKAVGQDPVKKAQLAREFDIADQELRASDKILQEHREEVAQRLGLDPKDPETDLYARDKLYGERMGQLQNLDRKIGKTEEGGAQWKRLQAERELLMNRANRDGIEAYTDGAGLDIIVNRMQSKRNDKGEKMSVDELVKDPKFRIGKGNDLEHVSGRQLDNMMNDQTMMISEHLNAYNQGHESPYQTARALAKYGQRAGLVEAIKGTDLPIGHPMKEYYDMSSKLMAYKNDPAGMNKALEDYAGVGGTARDGLRKFANLSESAMPGLKDYSKHLPNMAAGEKLAPGQSTVPPGFSSRAKFRDWVRERDDQLVKGDEMVFRDWTNRQVTENQARIQSLGGEKAELENLGKEFLPEDFSKARNLLDSIMSLEKQLDNLPHTHNPADGSLFWEILRKIARDERTLEGLRERRRDYLAEHGEVPAHPDIAAIDRLIELLKDFESYIEKSMNDKMKNFILLPGPGYDVTAEEFEAEFLLKMLGDEVTTAAPDGASPGISKTLENEVTKKLMENQKASDEEAK